MKPRFISVASETLQQLSPHYEQRYPEMKTKLLKPANFIPPKIRAILILLLLTAYFSSACQTGPMPVPTGNIPLGPTGSTPVEDVEALPTHTKMAVASSTVTILPTATAMPSATPTDEPIPTATASATPTVTPQVAQVSGGAIAYTGPGSNYPQLMTFYEPISLTVQGADESGAWLCVAITDFETGWMAAEAVDSPAKIDKMPVVPTPEGLATVTPAPVAEISAVAYETYATIWDSGGLGPKPVVMIEVKSQAALHPFNLEIRDAQGRLVSDKDYKTKNDGTVSVILARKLFEPGEYTIRISTYTGFELVIPLQVKKFGE